MKTKPPAVARPPAGGEITGGVDTRKDFHVAAAKDALGRELGTARFPAAQAGYTAILAWRQAFGPVAVVVVQGTGCYGAGLTHLLQHGVRVIEGNLPNRPNAALAAGAQPNHAGQEVRSRENSGGGTDFLTRVVASRQAGRG